MTTYLSAKSYSPSSFLGFKSSSDRVLNPLRRALFASLLAGLIWLSGLSSHPAYAMPLTMSMSEEVATKVDNPVDSDHMNGLVTCLPKQLSQPSLKRALSEMVNDQIERALNLKAKPKLSQAEIELANCLNR
jgi:hypothetical protein